MKKILITFILLISINSMYSEEVDFSTLSEKKILKIIDEAIEGKDQELITIMGNMGPEFPNYKLYESHILEQAKSFIDSDDLNYPLMLVEAVLYNNLENSEAQQLYSSIVNKNIEIQERIVAEKEQELVRAENEKRLAAQIGKEVSIEDEKARIVSITKELEQHNSNLPTKTTFIYHNYFYPYLKRNYASEVYNQYTNSDPGVNGVEGKGFELSLGLNAKVLMFRFDIMGDLTTKHLIEETAKQIFSNATLSLGFNAGPIPIFLRSGFLYNSYIYNDDEDVDMAITGLMSPTIGFGVSDLSLFKIVKIDLSSDYILASNFTDNFSYGFNTRGYLTINIFRSSRYNFEIKGGIDYLYFMEEGLSEYSYTPKIGVGLSRYE